MLKSFFRLENQHLKFYFILFYFYLGSNTGSLRLYATVTIYSNFFCFFFFLIFVSLIFFYCKLLFFLLNCFVICTSLLSFNTFYDSCFLRMFRRMNYFPTRNQTKYRITKQAKRNAQNRPMRKNGGENQGKW